MRRVLVETAWHYQHRPGTGVALARRRAGQPTRVIAIADKAQQRLCRRFRKLTAEHKPAGKVVVAIARELTGSCGPRCNRRRRGHTEAPAARPPSAKGLVVTSCGDGPRRRRMIRGTIRRTRELAMRYGRQRSQLALLDCTSSRRSTVMCARPRSGAVTTEYQRDSSSKRPRSSVVFAAHSSPRRREYRCYASQLTLPGQDPRLIDRWGA